MSLAGSHGFVHRKGILPWLIRKFTRGHWDHTFVFITDSIIMESTLFRGVHYNNIKKYFGKTVAVTSPQWGSLDVEKHEQVHTEMLFNVYGILQFVGFLWVLCFHRQHNPLTDGTVCSEWNWIHATRVWRDSKIESRIFKNNCNPNNLFSYQEAEWEVLFTTSSLSESNLDVAKAVVAAKEIR